ncbi:MAG: cytochrome b/b6 domain-containing protein [Xenophilus sp.]
MPTVSEPAASPLPALRVWDLPTRLFHWVLAAVVAALVATAKAGVMEWHFRLGYVAMALLLFRLLWGFAGGRWSRFAAFVYRPSAVLAHLRGQAPLAHRVGHSPLGALSVFALLAVLLLQVATGLVSDDAISFTGPLADKVPGAWSDAGTHWHKALGQWLVIGLALLHVAAVLFYTLFKRQDLVRAMVVGDRRLAEGGPALPPSRDDTVSRLGAAALFGLCAALAAWVASMQR